MERYKNSHAWLLLGMEMGTDILESYLAQLKAN